MSAKNVRRFRLIGLVIAVVLAIAFREKILLIAGVYWGFVILLTIALKFISPDEYAKLKSASNEDEQEESQAVEGSALKSEDESDGLRDSYLNGKYSFAILVISFIAVLVGGIVFIALTGVTYDENQVYLAKECFFNRTFGDFIIFQIAPLIIAAVLTASGCVSIYELTTGVVTSEEKKKYSVSLWKSILLAVVPVTIVVAMLFTILNWATVLTEDGIEVYRPGKETAYYQWDEMISFTCDEGDSFSYPEVDIKFENGEEMNIYFGHFKRESDKLYEDYGHIWEDEKVVTESERFFRHIFLEKYAHLNDTDTQN